MNGTPSPVQTVLLVVGGVALPGALVWMSLSRSGALASKNDFKPVAMPGAPPPKPGEKRGPGSHPGGFAAQPPGGAPMAPTGP